MTGIIRDAQIDYEQLSGIFFAFLDNCIARGGKLRRGAFERLLGVFKVVWHRLDYHELLISSYPCGRAYGLSESASHSIRDTICPRTSGELVLPKDVMRVDKDLQEIVARTDHLCQKPVRANSRRLDGDMPNLTRLDGAQAQANGIISFRPVLKLGYPGIRNTAHILPSGIRLSFNLPVH